MKYTWYTGYFFFEKTTNLGIQEFELLTQETGVLKDDHQSRMKISKTVIFRDTEKNLMVARWEWGLGMGEKAKESESTNW